MERGEPSSQKSFLWRVRSLWEKPKVDLPQSRRVELDGPITDELAKKVIAQILFYNMENPRAPIDLSVNSPGGSLTATFAIVDTIKFVEAPIHTSCSEMAVASALLVLAHGKKGHRTAAAGAQFGFVRTRAGANATNDDRARFFLRKIQRNLISLFVEASGRTRREIILMMKRETYFTASEPEAAGFVDVVASAAP